MSSHSEEVPGISEATRNYRIAELISSKISQPLRDVVVAMVLAGKSESEIEDAAGITARVLLKTLSRHLDRGGRTSRCEAE